MNVVAHLSGQSCHQLPRNLCQESISGSQDPILSGLPYVVIFFTAFFSGIWSDKLINRAFVPATVVRKIMQGVGTFWSFQSGESARCFCRVRFSQNPDFDARKLNPVSRLCFFCFPSEKLNFNSAPAACFRNHHSCGNDDRNGVFEMQSLGAGHQHAGHRSGLLRLPVQRARRQSPRRGAQVPRLQLSPNPLGQGAVVSFVGCRAQDGCAESTSPRQYCLL